MALTRPLAQALQALDRAVSTLEGTVARSAEADAARLKILAGANAEVGRRLDGLVTELRTLAKRQPSRDDDTDPG